ncbi:hypothetical protein Q1695_006868 [Nippostrongylus brasiliensis]|nr:hypothetical protein Q1695_006868 [Nippostrongylus brasiliensis]
MFRVALSENGGGDDYRDNVSTRVYLGSEVSAIDPEVHRCLERAIESMMKTTGCSEYELQHVSISPIDECYQNAQIASLGAHPPPISEDALEDEIQSELDKWSFGNSLLFSFSVITTIGYGHVAPVTFRGRLFCIIYGLIGVPVTLLTVADLGMFLSILLRKIVNCVYNRIIMSCGRRKWKPSKLNAPVSNDAVNEKDGMLPTAHDLKGSEEELEERPSDSDPTKTGEAVALCMTFVCYLLLGAKVVSVYEPEMDFFKAFYFNFVTLTTIGLGDFVPRSFDYLFITLCYIGVGLALTTMAIELAADLLRKLHYIGRKMDNIASTVVWFGGKKMTMKQLIKNLGDQFNIPEEDMAKFNLNEFVDNAMKVEAGEIKTLRKPLSPVMMRDDDAVSFSKLRDSSASDIRYVDERWSKYTDFPGDSVRTMETLPMNEGRRPGMEVAIPRIDLDCPFFTDSSLPTSFDDEYLRSVTKRVNQ